MAVSYDENPQFGPYADPTRLVSTQWPTDHLGTGDDVIAYCRTGERSSHAWFVLTYLLGSENVPNYDSSWTEWDNAARVPIVRGEEPGQVPAR